MRPQFHFTAERGWINDPHGITFREGRYHLFYQYVPDSVEWGPNCHWGHATSADLFSFQTLPVALAPGDGDDGIWTGCVVTDDRGRATILYTAVQQPEVGMGRVRTATPVDDSWIEWRKGPVVAEAPADLDVVAYRDPFVVHADAHGRDGWQMLVGAGLADGTACALSYVSSALAAWTYQGIAAQRSTEVTEPVWTGALWECPQVFELDGRHVMVTSVWDADVPYYAAYAIGDLDDGTFTAQAWGRLTFGDVYYAPSFFRDSDGHACLMFWLRGVGGGDLGWAGAHSVPHALHIVDDRLVATPHRGLEALRAPASEDQRVDGLAADVSWMGTRLSLLSGGQAAAAVEIIDGRLHLTAGDSASVMPFAGGPVRLVVDGQILEVSSGLLAAVIRPAGDHLAVDGDGTVTHLFPVRVA
jgi:beta-fructofuranosidase